MYDHKNIEKKWQQIWENNSEYEAIDFDTKPKYYVLSMFPYPSGNGLHVGHISCYTPGDVLARYKKMCGFNVLHPMGYDSFGLPAEQKAIKDGTSPQESTTASINIFRQQLKSIGFAYDEKFLHLIQIITNLLNGFFLNFSKRVTHMNLKLK